MLTLSPTLRTLRDTTREIASTVTAFIAVKWLLKYIQTHRFTGFAWYRIALGGALLLLVR